MMEVDPMRKVVSTTSQPGPLPTFKQIPRYLPGPHDSKPTFTT